MDGGDFGNGRINGQRDAEAAVRVRRLQRKRVTHSENGSRLQLVDAGFSVAYNLLESSNMLLVLCIEAIESTRFVTNDY